MTVVRGLVCLAYGVRLVGRPEHLAGVRRMNGDM